MNIDHIQFELRPRRLDEIFDFAVTVLRHHPGLFFGFAVPQILVYLLLNVALIGFLRGSMDGTREFETFWPALLLLLVLLAEHSALRLPLLLANGRLLFQQRVRAREVFSDIRAVAAAYIWRSILIRNLFLFVLWPRYFFLSEVVALERSESGKIRPRLENLTRRQSDRILGFRLLAFALGLIFLAVGMFVWSSVLEIPGLGGELWYFSDKISIFTPMTHLIFFVFSVYHSTARFLFYIDTRSQLEGWDIEKMLLKGVRESTGTG